MRAGLLAVAAVAVACALLFARPHPTPGPPMRDFEAYYAAGMTWNAGGDPYSQQIWHAEKTLAGINGSRYEALPFAGPPALLPLFGLLALLPFGIANAVWRTVLVISLAGLALLTLKLAGIRITPISCLAAAVAALGFGPLTSALSLGQIALPAFAFAALGVLRPAATVFAWAQPNVALTQAVQVFSKRTAAQFIAGGALFAIICVLVSHGSLRYIEILQRHGAAERLSGIQITPAAIAYGLGASPGIAQSIGTAIAIAALCCWLLLMRRVTGAIARFCATCALLPLAMPFFHEHDLLVLFVPAVLYATRAGAAWTAAAFGALFAATDWLGLAQRPDGVLQTLLLIGGLGAALVALHENPRARMLAVPAAVLVFIAAISLAARAHPQPVWPDAMGALPIQVTSSNIAVAWNEEQRATGLFAQVPAWAALRALSLGGSILLAVAVALSSKSPADSRNPSPVPA